MTKHLRKSALRQIDHKLVANVSTAVAAGVVLSLGTAALNYLLAKRAEQKNPPMGHFITVKGVKLHYFEQGQGTPLVLLHGNASMIQDFHCSGLIDLASANYRVITFDRPGYGYSERPRGVVWNPTEQADLITAALKKIGIKQAIVLGHSWGSLVAIAMAQKQETVVKALVLASGYYYPTFRLDGWMAAAGALPVIGNFLNHTISPLMARLNWPLMLRTMFGPNAVPKKYNAFPKELAVRPSQLRAGSVEGSIMVHSAAAAEGRYDRLRMPVAIVAGLEDKVVDPEQAAKLHRDIAHSSYDPIPATGHMVHQTATDRVMSAIEEAAAAIRSTTDPVVADTVTAVAA